MAITLIRHHRFKRGLTLTLAQDFGKARDWLSQHKRDPSLWIIVLGPLTMAAFTFWGLFVFPPSGAIRAISQVLPNTEIAVGPKNFLKCSGRTFIFGYEVGITHVRDVGRACRDIVNGGWVLDIDPKYK